MSTTGSGQRRILALNPFHGGSHRAFLESWMRHSRHVFTTLTLPPSHWKWRMRHASIGFTERAKELHDGGERFDAVFATDMMNMAEFRGLATPEIASLPTALYFHESQLTYPSRGSEASRLRDLHFAFTNAISAHAADGVWFNSGYHRRVFFESLRAPPSHAGPSADRDDRRDRSEVSRSFPAGRGSGAIGAIARRPAPHRVGLALGARQRRPNSSSTPSARSTRGALTSASA